MMGFSNLQSFVPWEVIWYYGGRYKDKNRLVLCFFFPRGGRVRGILSIRLFRWNLPTKECDTLFHLDLSYNSLSSADCEVFGEALKENHTLFGLHLAGEVVSILYCKVLKEDEWRDIIATESVDFPSRREAMGLMWMTLVWSKSSWHMGHRNKWRRHSGSHKGGLITSLLSFLAVETAERITLTIWHCCILSIHMYVYIYIYIYLILYDKCSICNSFNMRYIHLYHLYHFVKWQACINGSLLTSFVRSCSSGSAYGGNWTVGCGVCPSNSGPSAWVGLWRSNWMGWCELGVWKTWYNFCLKDSFKKQVIYA